MYLQSGFSKQKIHVTGTIYKATPTHDVAFNLEQKTSEASKSVCKPRDPYLMKTHSIIYSTEE